MTFEDIKPSSDRGTLGVITDHNSKKNDVFKIIGEDNESSLEPDLFSSLVDQMGASISSMSRGSFKQNQKAIPLIP